MGEYFDVIDISEAPALQRIAALVRITGKPCALVEDGKTVAVVRPAPKNGKSASSSPRAKRTGNAQPSPMDDPEFARMAEESHAANMAKREETLALLKPPTPEQLARRKEVAERILANREHRNIAPLTSADLIHIARAEEEEGYGFGR